MPKKMTEEQFDDALSDVADALKVAQQAVADLECAETCEKVLDLEANVVEAIGNLSRALKSSKRIYATILKATPDTRFC
jgi:acyl-CoA reductase-like NAD-dependent aldehyde dehydrogenase